MILDSNVWIAFFNINDSQHKKAEKIFVSLTQKIILPEYIILEVCSVLSLRANKKIANQFIEFSLYNKDVEILLSNNEFFGETLKTFLNYFKKDLSFVDIFLLSLSASYKIITFDKKLEKAIKEKV